MISRSIERRLVEHLNYFPAIALIGPRQVGKTTSAKRISLVLEKPTLYLDLESISDAAKLEDAEMYLSQHIKELVVIDEVQRRPDLFPLLRSLIDRERVPGRFLLLGSASPDLIRDSSESLAGRISYLEMTPMHYAELKQFYSIDHLWLKGGFPDVVLGNVPLMLWMNNFIQTYIERDLMIVGFTGNSIKAGRLWRMLAHYHANTLNYAELGRSLELSSVTIKSYIDFFEKSFLVRQLSPYHTNLATRIVKSQKIYLRDSGILHFMLGLESMEQLLNHPKLGASWEGFVVDQIAACLPSSEPLYYYKTMDGAEIDLVIERAGKPYIAIEIKFGSEHKPGKGNILASKSLGAPHNFIITHSGEDYLHSSGFRICPLDAFLSWYLPELTPTYDI